MSKVLVTPRSVTRGGHPSLARLTDAGYEIEFCKPGEQPSEEELIALLPGCVGYLAGVEKVTERVLSAAGTLKVISRNGTGVDNIDLPAAECLGVEILRADGTNARGVAELTIGLMLALARGIPYGDATMKRGEWVRRKGVELEGRTLGLVGCGRIGKLVAGFALALGMRVAAFDVCEDQQFAHSPAFSYAPLDQVLRESDFVSLHCPASSDGAALVDSDAISRMKKGAFVVNTARASLLDWKAISLAIKNGHVAGVATDVFETEPPDDLGPLASDRIIATPHVGGLTEESVSRAMSAAVGNLLDFLGEQEAR